MKSVIKVQGEIVRLHGGCFHGKVLSTLARVQGVTAAPAIAWTGGTLFTWEEAHERLKKSVIRQGVWLWATIVPGTQDVPRLLG